MKFNIVLDIVKKKIKNWDEKWKIKCILKFFFYYIKNNSKFHSL